MYARVPWEIVSTAPLAIAYLFWEISVSAISYVALARIRSAPLKLSLIICCNITIGALCATVFCFLKLNRPIVYLASAAVFAAAAILWGRQRRAAERQPRGWAAAYVPDAMAICFALGVMLALSIRPIEDVDSLANLHSMMGWVQNLTTPYQFANNYVPFWELSYVPGIVLTSSDLFFWYNSLKPVLLLGLMLFLIARELDLPDRFAIWAIPFLMLFPHLWLGPSGVSTIKTDMIYAASYAMFALVAARAANGRATAADAALAAFAAAFVSVKFSGPVVLLLGGAAFAMLASRWIAGNLKIAARAGCVMAIFWFVTVGHYYLHNLLAYGNPVYPYQINFGPIHLPGRADLSGTSILYSLRYPQLWRFLFLPERGLSPAGILFPVVLPAILIGSLVLVAAAVRRRRVAAVTALALFELIAWFVYFRSIYSASAWPGDLVFLRTDLNSLRYVEGALLVGELGLVWALYRMHVPRSLILLLLAIQGSTSFMVILRRAPDRPWLPAVLCGCALLAFALSLARRMRISVAVAAVLISLSAGTWLVERRRPLWLHQLQPLYLPLYEASSQDLFYLIDDEFSQQPCWHFPFLGHRLQHSVDSGPLSKLFSRPVPPRYVAWTRRTPDAPALALPGFNIVVTAAEGTLFERQDRRPPAPE
ncbi:MAG: hypothetical protein ABSH24_37000 [Bryobacteraceae bacterium]|jgi:hypothetical protein